MRSVYYSILVISISFLFSCNDYTKPSVKSFEITLEKDTINLTDFNGLKQGKWIIKKDTVVDTVFYKDGVPQ